MVVLAPSAFMLATLGALVSLHSGLVGADEPFYHDLKAFQNGTFGERPSQGFYSSPLRAPVYQVNKLQPERADKSPYYFLTGRYGEGFGPSIVSAKDLSLIWADETYNLAQAAESYIFKGQRVLGVHAGEAIRIYNQHYEQLYVVRPQGNMTGVNPDSHESYLTKDDTVVSMGCPPAEADLRPLDGPKDGLVMDCALQEIDPVTNEVLFQFATLDYFSVSDSLWPYEGDGVFDLGHGAHDFCHMNSAQKTPEGDFLISYRHFSTIAMVDGKTHNVKWVMGGRRNRFTDITVNGSAEFAYQHNARMTGKNRFTIFDNGGLNNDFCHHSRCSRGLELQYDPVNMTVEVVNEWYHPQKIMSTSRGGVQRLPNGGTLVAWGQNAMYTEYTPEGEVVMDFQRGRVVNDPHGIPPIIAYRAFKGEWEGKPTWGPNISANHFPGGETKIFVSWNGATEVDQWVLLLSDSRKDLDGPEKVAAYSPRRGFETGFDLPFPATFARAAALNKDGVIIGSTPAVNIKSGTLHALTYEIARVHMSRLVGVQETEQEAEPTTNGGGGKGDQAGGQPTTENVAQTTTTESSHRWRPTVDDPEVDAMALFYMAVIFAVCVAIVGLFLTFRRRIQYRALCYKEISSLLPFQD